MSISDDIKLVRIKVGLWCRKRSEGCECAHEEIEYGVKPGPFRPFPVCKIVTVKVEDTPDGYVTWTEVFSEYKQLGFNNSSEFKDVYGSFFPEKGYQSP
ncbi:hypothetical protein [Brevibacillus laterosporus]|uniref:hypothetical protein n=1 Tax=Brevibacillus laterosporus TaxID=1465 RepID=UPI003D1F2019